MQRTKQVRQVIAVRKGQWLAADGTGKVGGAPMVDANLCLELGVDNKHIQCVNIH